MILIIIFFTLVTNSHQNVYILFLDLVSLNTTPIIIATTPPTCVEITCASLKKNNNTTNEEIFSTSSVTETSEEGLYKF